MTRVLLTGAGGMLGRDLATALDYLDLTAATKHDLDITDQDQVTQAVTGHDVVVNAAAYTAVDKAEQEPERAFSINAEGPRLLARAAATHGATLIHLSTDYVFDGKATTPYSEDTPLNPQSAYGQSKAAGEEAVLAEHPDGAVIVRTAWLYGEGGSHFPGSMLRVADSHNTVSVVTDQIGQPTWSRDLAGWIRNLIDARVPSGIFHGTNAGETSWWDFARVIFHRAGLDPERVLPTTSDHFVRPATRPAWSVLGHNKWTDVGLATPRAWTDAFDEAFPALFPEHMS